jgi:cation diffusion facilitator family transporter
MEKDCCVGKCEELQTLATMQSRVLWIVLSMNAVMFLVELSTGLYFHSLALTGDSLDMLGDAMAYGSSLYVVKKGVVAKARASQFKAGLMIVLGFFFVGNAVYRVIYGGLPSSTAMSLVGGLALVSNLICLILLARHKSDDINFTSVWLCSRNDIVANLSVIVAAGLVYLTGTNWPDIIVGIGIATLFLKSAFFILKESRAILDDNNR